LTTEEIKTHRDSFFSIFDKNLKEESVEVRVAAFKATCAFLQSTDDQEVLKKFK